MCYFVKAGSISARIVFGTRCKDYCLNISVVKHTQVKPVMKSSYISYVCFLGCFKLFALSDPSSATSDSDHISFEKNYRVHRNFSLDRSIVYPITVSKHGIIEFGIHNLLEIYLNDTEYQSILQHGCWCAKFNPNSNLSVLGGSSVDSLDQICKEWIVARHCNRLPGGSCENENNFNVKRGFYNIELSNLDLPGCSDNIGFCSQDSCEIDVFYALKIRDFVAVSGVSASVISGGCTGKVSEHRQRACEGTVPDNLVIVG